MTDATETFCGLRLERHEAVAVVRLDNPPLNLLTQDIRRAVGTFFATVTEDRGVRAIVFGAGPQHFCAGADMKEFPLRFDPETARLHGENGHRMMRELVRCGVPVIAAIEGACLGGGLELALACDFRVAARSAKLGLPEIRRGVWPGTGGIPLLARLIGDHAAKAMVWSGETLEAAEAHRRGIVDTLTKEGDAFETALARARELAGQPAAAVRTVKDLIDWQFRDGFDAYLGRELDAYVACYQTRDAREGNAAFFEKRPPVWSHE